MWHNFFQILKWLALRRIVSSTGRTHEEYVDSIYKFNFSYQRLFYLNSFFWNTHEESRPKFLFFIFRLTILPIEAAGSHPSFVSYQNYDLVNSVRKDGRVLTRVTGALDWLLWLPFVQTHTTATQGLNTVPCSCCNRYNLISITENKISRNAEIRLGVKWVTHHPKWALTWTFDVV